MKHNIYFIEGFQQQVKKTKKQNKKPSIFVQEQKIVVTRHEKQSNIIICGVIKKPANVQIKTFSKIFSHSAVNIIFIFHKHIIPHENG